MLLEFDQRSLHRRGIDERLRLLIGLLATVEILLQGLAFAYTACARHRAELRAVHRHPLSPDQPAGTS